LVAGRRVLYAVPTQDQADKFWYEVKQALGPAIDAGQLIKNETRRYIEEAGTERRLRCKTAFNADTLRGDYADLLILDEFQMMHESVWDQVGAPMLLDNDGDAVFIYTPPSRRTRHLSRADDKHHAAKLFQHAEQDATERWATFHFTSRSNPHISMAAIDALSADMLQATIRQEIEALDEDEVEGALWKRAEIDHYRVSRVPEMIGITVGVDPTGSATGDACGIVVVGKGVDGQGYVLEDCTVNGSPARWAGQAVAAYHRWQANRIVAEGNYGGDMVAHTLQMIPGAPFVELVHASRGKLVRADPIAALSERGGFHMAGVFDDLEDELVSYDGTGKSPNRLDAMVFAAVDLNLHIPSDSLGIA
jgi:hypothetical protein